MMSLACRGGLALRDHARKRVGAADDVDMKMIHVLTPDPAGVDDRAEAVGRALLAREPRGTREDAPQHVRVGVGRRGERIDVLLGDDHEVHRRHRIDVVEGEHLLVLVHLAARDLARDDLAEDAIGFAHGSCPLSREAFSSRPERPSRRSSSASTSANAMPCHDSITSRWKKRSAVSWTIEPRSSLLDAITVSTASSATFLRIWSWPFACSCAT